MRLLLIALLLALLAACQPDAPPPPPAPVADQANANPLQGTVLETQGEALRKAKAVQDIADKQAQQQKDALDQAMGQ